jgi:hypothetical protein
MWRKFRRWALLAPPHSLIAELKPWGPEWRDAARFWGVLIVLLLGTHWLSKVWVFEYAGLFSSDALARLRPPEPAEHTRIVTITADERRTLLSGTSPIPVLKLRQAVCAVLRAKPEVLGIDVDTSHVDIPAPPNTRTKIVWARGIQITRTLDERGEAQIRTSPDYLLGRANPDVLNGLAVAPVMPDWSVRSIPTCYEYDKGRVMPTMIGVLAKAAGRAVGECGGEEEHSEVGAYRIHYNFDRFTLKDFAPGRLDETALDRCQRGEGEWSEGAASTHPPLKDKVVLLGGEYDPQDWHETPWGLEPGVEIQASLTEHLLSGTSAQEIETPVEFAVKLLLAIFIAFIHCRFRPMAALLLCLAGLGSLVMTGGLLALYFTAYRAAMVPFLLGIVIEQLVTSAEKAQKAGNHVFDHGAASAGAGAVRSGHS